jgi:hypothetical protein
MIDLYCERTAKGFWNEPINALTNGFFLLAAFFSWKLAKKQFKKIPASIYFLIFLLFAIGTGSFLFHTFAEKWSLILDVTPILIFQLAFIWIYLKNIVKTKIYIIIFALIILVGLSAVSAQFSGVLNGSLPYLPTLVFLTGFGVYHKVKGKNEPLILIIAAILFVLSLTFRSIDNVICGHVKTGSHFLWHTLNALVLYMVTRAAILNYET